jgi:hypothetical protein
MRRFAVKTRCIASLQSPRPAITPRHVGAGLAPALNEATKATTNTHATLAGQRKPYSQPYKQQNHLSSAAMISHLHKTLLPYYIIPQSDDLLRVES